MIGTSIREWRVRNGFTQQQIAEACQKSVRTIQNWEAGNSEPLASDVRAINEAYKGFSRACGL